MKNLASKALLVTLTICQWTARKYDRKVSKEVDDAHKAQDAGRYNKLLIAKNNLTEISKIANEARDFHYENTLPWADKGDRLLPTMNYFEYTSAISRYKTSFEAAVDKFVQAYPSMKLDAAIRLNTLFDEADYPNDIEDRFSIKVDMMPVPETNDFRVDLSQENVDAIKAHIESQVKDRFYTATLSVYERITDQLKKMHERLKDKDNVFRDSLFTNLGDLIKLLPRLNISEDPRIDALCEDMKSLLVDPEDVRKDVALRSQKANEVNAILRNIDTFFNITPAPKTNPAEEVC